MEKRQPQVENLLEEIRTCIEEERYVQTSHAFLRQQERKIALPDALYVLKHGYHEKRKTKYDHEHHTWKYAIRSKTKDDHHNGDSHLKGKRVEYERKNN